MHPAAATLPLKKRSTSTEPPPEHAQRIDAELQLQAAGGDGAAPANVAAAPGAEAAAAVGAVAPVAQPADGGIRDPAVEEPPPKRQRQEEGGVAPVADFASASAPANIAAQAAQPLLQAQRPQQAQQRVEALPAQQPAHTPAAEAAQASAGEQEHQHPAPPQQPSQQQPGQPSIAHRAQGPEQQQQQQQRARRSPQKSPQQSPRSQPQSPARPADSGGEAQASSDHAAFQRATSAAPDSASPRGATSRRETLQPHHRDPSFEFGHVASQAPASAIGAGFPHAGLPHISTTPQPLLLSKAVVEELSGSKLAEGGSPLSGASWLRTGSNSNDYSSQTLASFGLRPSGGSIPSSNLSGAPQRIFGVDVSPGGSPLLAPSGPSDSIRSLQSSPRSAFTAVASLQSARSSSVSNVRAELARLLPGLSPFTALAEPLQQGLAGSQGSAAHQQGLGGQHPLAAAQQQGLSAGQPGSAAGQHLVGHPAAGDGGTAADALAAAATYASNRAAQSRAAANLTSMASLQGWAAPHSASPGASPPGVAAAAVPGTGRGSNGGTPLAGVGPNPFSTPFSAAAAANLGLGNPHLRDYSLSGAGTLPGIGDAAARGIDAAAVAYGNPFARRSQHSQEVERLLGRTPSTGNAGVALPSGLRPLAGYSPADRGSGGGMGSDPPNRIRTSSVPDHVWAAKASRPLPTRAAAEIASAQAAAAAELEPHHQQQASLRVQSDPAALFRHRAAAAAAGLPLGALGSVHPGAGPAHFGEPGFGHQYAAQQPGAQLRGASAAMQSEGARQLLQGGHGGGSAALDPAWIGSLPKKARTPPELLSHARGSGGGGSGAGRRGGDGGATGGGGGGGGGGRRGPQPPQQAAIEQHYLAELRKFIEEKGGTLAPGWSVRVRTRSVLLHGKERQQKDAFYHSPAGDTYNSRKKVAVSMGLMSADDNTRTASIPRLPAASAAPPATPQQHAPGWDGGAAGGGTQQVQTVAAASPETAPRQEAAASGGEAAQQHQWPRSCGASPMSARSQPAGTSGTETDGDGDAPPGGSGGEGCGGDVGGGPSRSTRQQQHNKEAQKRYRERKRERSVLLEARAEEAGSQLAGALRQLAALRGELAALAASNEELRGAVAGRDADIARLRQETDALLAATARGDPSPHLQAVLASKEAALARRGGTGADAAGWRAARLSALAAENAELRAALRAA